MPATGLLTTSTPDQWAIALWARRNWIVEDLPRLEAAFIAVWGKAKRWPSPADVFDALPRVDQMLVPASHMLTQGRSPEWYETQSARIKALLDSLDFQP